MSASCIHPITPLLLTPYSLLISCTTSCPYFDLILVSYTSYISSIDLAHIHTFDHQNSTPANPRHKLILPISRSDASSNSQIHFDLFYASVHQTESRRFDSVSEHYTTNHSSHRSNRHRSFGVPITQDNGRGHVASSSFRIRIYIRGIERTGICSSPSFPPIVDILLSPFGSTRLVV